MSARPDASAPERGILDVTPVYTDVIFGANQEKRGRRILAIGLWVLGVLGIGWTIAMWLVHGPQFTVVLNGAISVTAFWLLAIGPRVPYLRLAHIVFWATLIYVWFVQLKLEGLLAAHVASSHFWFLVLVMGTFLLLIREKRWVIISYTSLALGSFVASEFALVKMPSAIGSEPGDLLIVRTVTYLTVFVTVVLLMQAWSTEVRDAEEHLTTANNRLESLIENMLPPSISRRLRMEGRTFADGIAECSVLFTDLVGFTKMSSHMPAGDLVHLLDEIFSRFDELTVKAGLEKIKTIGDSYMVAAGLPDPRPDHAQALIELALEMQKVIREYDLHVRTGINSGSVVAGVIGKKKFIYDLWGDTVNVASRMESQGVVDEIQITQATANLVAAEYQLQPRGQIAIKGKGEMPVYLVTGRHQPLPG